MDTSRAIHNGALVFFAYVLFMACTLPWTAQACNPIEVWHPGPVSRLAFVTGATGFLGLNLVDQLCAAGWHVVAMHRHTASLSWLARFPVETVVGDLCMPETLLEAMPMECDAVFHVAADTSLWRARRKRQWQTNVMGTHRLLEAAQKRHARTFIYTSCWSTYGLHRTDVDTINEHVGQHRQYRRHFDHTKALAEDAVRAANRPQFTTVILNPAYLVGPYDRDAFTHMLKLAHVGRLAGVPPGGAEFCHAGEVARAHIAAVDHGVGGENYLLGGVRASFVEMAQIVGQLTGQPVPKRPMSQLSMRMSARLSVMLSALTRQEPDLTPDGARAMQRHPAVDSALAEHDLGYRRIGLEEMLSDTYLWMKDTGLVR